MYVFILYVCGQCVQVHIHVCVCICVRMCICACVCIRAPCVCKCVHMCVHVCECHPEVDIRALHQQSPPCPLRQGLTVEPRVCQYGCCNPLACSRNPCRHSSAIYIYVGNLNCRILTPVLMFVWYLLYPLKHSPPPLGSVFICICSCCMCAIVNWTCAGFPRKGMEGTGQWSELQDVKETSSVHTASTTSSVSSPPCSVASSQLWATLTMAGRVLCFHATWLLLCCSFVENLLPHLPWPV